MSNEKRTRRVCASLALMVLTSTTILTGMAPVMTQAADEEQAPATSSVLVTPSLEAPAESTPVADTPVAEDATEVEAPAEEVEETEDASEAPEAETPIVENEVEAADDSVVDTDNATPEVVTDAAAASTAAPTEKALPPVVEQGDWGTVEWTLTNDGTLFLKGGVGDDAGYESPWSAIADQVKEVSFVDTVVAPADSSFLFDNFTNVTAYTNIEMLDTSRVEGMYRMFGGNESLTSLDVSHFNVANVTDMNWMFEETAMTEVDLTAWTFNPEVQMTGTFAFMNQLTTVNFGNATFAYPQSVFWGSADNLETLIVGDETLLMDIPIESGMHWEGQTTGHTFLAEYFGGHGDTYTLLPAAKQGEWGSVAWEIDDEGTLTLSGGVGVATNGRSPWQTHASQINKVVIAGDIEAPADSSRLFRDFVNLTSIENADRLDVSKVTNMDEMFEWTYALTELDVSQWDTGQVTSMRWMFNGTGLSALDVGDWNVSQVANFEYMFAWADQLTTLPIEYWQVSDGSDLHSFLRGTQLETVDLSRWDAKSVSINEAFTDMAELKTLDISGLQIEEGYGERIFYDTQQLEVFTIGTNTILSELGTPSGQVWTGDKTGHQFGKYYNDGFADTYRLTDGELGYIRLGFDDHTLGEGNGWRGPLLYGKLGETVDWSQVELMEGYELVDPKAKVVLQPLDEDGEVEEQTVAIKQIPKVTTRRITFTGLPKGTLKDVVQEVKWHWNWIWSMDNEDDEAERRRADVGTEDSDPIYLPQGHYEAYTIPSVPGYKAEVTTVDALHIDTSEPITELNHAEDVTVHFTKLAAGSGDSSDTDTDDATGDSSVGGANSGSGTSAGSSNGSGSSATASGNLPQTGAVAATGLTALGLGLLGMLGITWRKRRKG